MKPSFWNRHPILKDMLISDIISQLMYTDSDNFRTVYEDFLRTLEG